jgi:dipeptidyl aminopeptidase/acylaminoacyl peptidase
MVDIRRMAIAAALVGCFAQLAVQAASASALPAEAFGQLPAVSQPILTPDGKHFAALQSMNGKPVILIYQTDAPPSTKPIAIPTSDWIAEQLVWANNDRLILVIKKNYRPTGFDKIETWHRALAIGADGTNPVVLMADQRGFRYNGSSANIVGRDRNDPNYIYTVLYVPHMTVQPGSSHFNTSEDFNTFRLDLLKVDVNTGKTETVMIGEKDTIGWVVDDLGNVVARLDQTKRSLQDHLFLNRGGKFVEVAQFDASGDKWLDIEGLTEDGTGLVVTRADERAARVLDRIDLATGAVTTLFSVPGYDVGGAIHNRWTGRVIGAYYTDDRLEVHYFDPGRQALQDGLEKAFPETSVLQVSSNANDDRLIFMINGPRSPTSYYYYNRTTRQATQIASAYPGLKPADLGEEKPYPYKARDGLEIHAYLTLPPGKTPSALPTVIMPHGGPDARDELTFDWWAQFLANHGYAVLQPNFRGSSGYGRKFTEAGLHEWGLKMQDDITDGVKKLIADGIADPKRICIVGASYGGYATLAGATFTPDLYACAVSWAGVSDLPLILATELQSGGSDSRDSALMSFWHSRIGSAAEDEAKLIATSPARHANQVKCPILLMHGEADTTVRINQSEVEEKALRKAGKTVAFIRFTGGEDHYMNVAETRIRMLTEVEKFLKENIGN